MSVAKINNKMRVCVIGGGVAGLVSARHVIASGFECDVLESFSSLGGTWAYNDNYEKNSYQYVIYSTMYKGLRTNLPKEVMSFPDFRIEDESKSFLNQDDVFCFLNRYAEKFNIKSYIKLNHHVTEVKPNSKSKWQVTYVNKTTMQEYQEIYDALMVCCGIYNIPVHAYIPGTELFGGRQLHSYQFRSPEDFKDLRVLLIGAGASALDLVSSLSEISKKVTISHHFNVIPIQIPISNTDQKPDVKCILGSEQVEFTDGSLGYYDVIIYCTGYKYSYPFLHPSCGITVEDSHIHNLYKHMINIDYPTMCLIGIPFQVCAFRMFDLQARLFVKLLNDEVKLPPKEEMKQETSSYAQRKLENLGAKAVHAMFTCQQEYYDDLANFGKLETIPPVIAKMFNDCIMGIFGDIKNYRNYKYEVLDDINFKKNIL